MSRPTAATRFRRIVAIVPWIAARPGVELREVCERFDIAEQELIADLDVVFMVGIPPYTPDALIDVVIEEGRVWIHLGDAFSQPLRLTTGEALRLVAAGHGALAGSDPETRQELAGALAKVLRALGHEGVAPIEVELGDADASVLAELRRATEEHRRVRLDYYTYGSDTRSERDVDPIAVASREGHWYLFGHCHQAGAERVFRVDRIHAVSVSDETFVPPDDSEVPRPGPSAGAPTLTVEVDGGAAWLAEEYRADVLPDRDGRRRLRLVAGGDAWVQRALLQLGAGASVVDSDGGTDVERYRDLVRSAARSILDRYV